ncbi:MAG: hypothetical protein IKI57_04305 [Clostridia bacterium]|nr:hypothetical protein [Clostridia bacterium]
MEYVLNLLWPLSLTILIEYPIVQLLWLFVKDEENKSIFAFWKKRIIIIPAIIVNVLTNPSINVFARFLGKVNGMTYDLFWIIITIAELVVWAIEAALYKYMLNTKWSNAFLLSLSANYLSYMSSFVL